MIVGMSGSGTPAGPQGGGEIRRVLRLSGKDRDVAVVRGGGAGSDGGPASATIDRLCHRRVRNPETNIRLVPARAGHRRQR